MHISPITTTVPLTISPESTSAPPVVTTAVTPAGCPADTLDFIMAQMVRDADDDATIRSTEIRQRMRDTAKARMRVLEEIRKQSRAHKHSKKLSRFRKFLGIISAAIGAVAAIVAAPFTGGGSAAAYVGAVLTITAAAAGAASATTGMAAGHHNAVAARAGLSADSQSHDIDAGLEKVDNLAAQTRELIDNLTSIEQKAFAIIEREQRLADTALRSRTC